LGQQAENDTAMTTAICGSTAIFSGLIAAASFSFRQSIGSACASNTILPHSKGHKEYSILKAFHHCFIANPLYLTVCVQGLIFGLVAEKNTLRVTESSSASPADAHFSLIFNAWGVLMGGLWMWYYEKSVNREDWSLAQIAAYRCLVASSGCLRLFLPALCCHLSVSIASAIGSHAEEVENFVSDLHSFLKKTQISFRVVHH
jgi:hypothetical protein